MINKNIFEGKYEIIKQLGKGGMSTVYLARNIKLGNFWAIKVVNKNANEKIDLLAEPNIMKNLNHPGITRIFDIFEDDENIYIIEDYIDGASLDIKLNKVKKFNEDQVVSWAKQICDALNYLHKSKPNPIIYRDMKPANLMLTKAGDIKIIDFGIAREFKKEVQSDTTYIGTRGYAAPEQYGTSQTDERTDIYSLGVTLYHLVTGKGPNEPPYEIKPIREINPSLSAGLEHIINKCTKQNPKERYQSIDKLVHDLNNIEKFNYDYKKKVVIKNIKIIFLFCLLSFFVLLTKKGFAQLRQEKLDAYNTTLQSGKTLMTSKEYDGALKKFEEANDKFPQKISGYTEISKIYLLEGKYDECISYINEKVLTKVATAGKDSNIFYILGTAYFENNNYKDAVTYFEKSKSLSPEKVDNYRDLAVSYAKTGRFDEANATLNEIKVNKMYEEVTWYVSGEIYAAQKQFQDAFNSFNQCLNVTKDEELKKKTIISIAETYRDNEDSIGNGAIDKEIAILERGNSELKEKNNLNIVEMLAAALYDKALASDSNKEELYKKSISDFQILISSGYGRPYIYRNIAIIYQQLGDFSNSEQTLIKMEKLYPQDYTCYLQKALLYAEIENQKPNENRDYQKTYDNYLLAVKYNPSGENSSSLSQLNNLIQELKNDNWIK